MATIFYSASSLDGFIAGPGHSLEWLLSRDIDPAGPQSFDAFMVGVSAAVMGANTYQWILEHGDGTWPETLPTWVMTHRSFAPTEADIRFSSAPVAEVHAAASAAADGRNIWLVGGGELVGQFHDAGLLDEVHIQYAPATLGSGAALLPRRIDFDLIDLDRNREFACGRYRVRR